MLLSNNILLNYYELNKNIVSYIVDNSKLKIDKYVPNTDIQIKSKSTLINDPPDIILITAWNYAEEIINESITYYKFNGKFVIPLPNVKILN